MTSLLARIHPLGAVSDDLAIRKTACAIASRLRNQTCPCRICVLVPHPAEIATSVSAAKRRLGRGWTEFPTLCRSELLDPSPDAPREASGRSSEAGHDRRPSGRRLRSRGSESLESRPRCGRRPRTAARSHPSRNHRKPVHRPARSTDGVAAAVKSRGAVACRCGLKPTASRARVWITATRCTWACPATGFAALPEPSGSGARIGRTVGRSAGGGEAAARPSSSSLVDLLLPSSSFPYRGVSCGRTGRGADRVGTAPECAKHFLTALQVSSPLHVGTVSDSRS